MANTHTHTVIMLLLQLKMKQHEENYENTFFRTSAKPAVLCHEAKQGMLRFSTSLLRPGRTDKRDRKTLEASISSHTFHHLLHITEWPGRTDAALNIMWGKPRQHRHSVWRRAGEWRQKSQKTTMAVLSRSS